MKVLIMQVKAARSDEELNLIQDLCIFEHIESERIFPDTDKELFRKHYKGNGKIPIIVKHNKGPDSIVYGFWEFSEYLLKNGMLLC